MKEIIKPGNTGVKITYNNTCPFCGCIYKYEQEDIIPNYNYTFGSYTICPCCEKENLAATFANFTDIITKYNNEWKSDNE